MKKLLVLVMVLAMASLASATLKISVDGVVDPLDSSINLLQSQTVVLDVHSDGQDLADAPGFMVIVGPGMVSLDSAVNLVNPSAPPMFWEGDPADGAVFMDFVIPGSTIPLLPVGTLADGIIFHCEGLGDVTISLYLDRSGIGGIFQLMDQQIIHQIPEPVTVALLGLGGLLLRRRIA
jgi:hypothetical protein